MTRRLHAARRRRAAARRHRGLTLLEMLVTLVLFSLISTLLWQALAQAARIEAQLADQRVLGETEALQRAWVQQALAGAATGAPEEPLRFDGRAQALDTWTTQPPWPTAGGLERMRLTLVSTQQRGATVTRVVAQRQPMDGNASSLAAGDEPAALSLWQWPGEGRLQYLDAQQQWSDTWPPQGTLAGSPAVALPRAIRLTGPPSGPLLVAVVATQNPMVRRRDLSIGDDELR